MKKKLLFLIPLLIVAVLLFMLRATGVKVHIAVSVVGLVLIVAYTLATSSRLREMGFSQRTLMPLSIALMEYST